jgi:hypothetical protein
MNGIRNLTRLILAFSLLMALASCGGATPVPTSAPTPVPTSISIIDASPAVTPQNPDQLHPVVGEIELSVMTFNIWIGGEVVDFHQVSEVIRR